MNRDGQESSPTPIVEAPCRPRLDHPFLAKLSPDDTEQVRRILAGLVELRHAEREVLEASERYMKLNTQEMRALHYLMSAKKLGEVVTPTMIAGYLKISPASTTKLLNRLEHGGHIVRRMHPVDRRAFAIDVTPETEASARQTLGNQHAKHVHAAARLSAEEREVVIRFLSDMTQEISIESADWARDNPDSRPPN